MDRGAIAVIDVGKTLAKLTLWDRKGTLIERRTRENRRFDAGAFISLDFAGIETWLAETLADFARLTRVGAIIPVGHGAGAVVVREGRPVCAPMDYEEPHPAALRADYDTLRDSFALTGSPALPDGLNLGVQLYALGTQHPDLYRHGTQILLWAQYWAWLLSGVATSEVTSLGCHTDLWRPNARRPSRLAVTQGWADCLPPVRGAGDVLGPISPEWARRTGLPADTAVYCGLHDSNAALLAARGFPAIADHESTVLSTGTWFVAMRTPAAGVVVDMQALPENRDCLVNVDAFGRPVPSARFMGGREIELLTGVDTRRVDIRPDQPALVAAVPDVIAAGAVVLPTFAPGFGPFPHGRGRWLAMPTDHAERRAAVCLYAALVADVALDLIGARERILVEGRFAEAEVFVRALASLRPDTRVYVSNAHNDVSYGALRLIEPSLAPDAALINVKPLDSDLGRYKANWHRDADRMEAAA